MESKPDFIDTIIVGDTLATLQQLPDDIIDITVTSPPYNKGEKHHGWLVSKVHYAANAPDNLPEDHYQEQQIAVLNELFRITKPGGSLFYNHKLRWHRGHLLHPITWLQRTLWTIRQEIIWDRMIAANIRGWRFWQVDERLYWLYKPIEANNIGSELKPNHAKLTSIWRFPPEKNNPHPAPFPLALPARCIYSVLDTATEKLVLDPYCGSGTTLVAAKLLKHHYLGIDIVPEYCDYALERLQNCHLEIPALHAELALHNTTKTFTDRKQQGDYTGKNSPTTYQPPLLS